MSNDTDDQMARHPGRSMINRNGDIDCGDVAKDGTVVSVSILAIDGDKRMPQTYTPDEMDRLVADRAIVLDKAQAVLGRPAHEFAGMTTSEIKTAVVRGTGLDSGLRTFSGDHLDAAFDAAVRKFDGREAVNKARAEMVDHMRNAHRGAL